jgi:hypothetical protein
MVYPIGPIGLRDAKDAADELQRAVQAATGIDIFSGIYANIPGLPYFMDGKIQFIKALRDFTKTCVEHIETRQTAITEARARADAALVAYQNAAADLKAAQSEVDRLTARTY